MRTIADKYIDEGIAQGTQFGETRGKYERTIEAAKNMLAAGSDISSISKFTVVSIAQNNDLLISYYFITNGFAALTLIWPR